MARPLPEQLLAQSPLWARCDGGTLILAVSGGRDSVALARAAHAVLAAMDFTFFCEVAPKLVLWHLDHGLRADSAGDAEFVRKLGVQLGAPVICESVDLRRQRDQDGGNLEELARRERYRRLFELCQSPPPGSPVSMPAVAATAHHLGDQAETVLHHIVRGTHLGGLRGIAPLYEDYVYRPWLALPPEEIQAYLASLGQDWREDATNADTALTRNLLRHEVMPRLLQINPRAREHIAKLASAAADAHRLYVQRTDQQHIYRPTLAQLSSVLPVFTEPAGMYEVHFSTDAWRAPDMLADYIGVQVARIKGSSSYADYLQASHWAMDPIEALQVREFSVSLLSRTCLVIQGATTTASQVSTVEIAHPDKRRFGKLAVSLSKPTLRQFDDHCQAKRNVWEQLNSWSDAVEAVALIRSKSNSKIFRPQWHCFLPGSVKLPLTLRTWQAGDRMTLTDGSTKKLGDIFTDAKVPQLFRAVWAVLADANGEVLWLPALADGRAMRIAAPDEPRWLLTLSQGR